MSDQPVSPATDVYGLGILAYHMLTGHLPFESESLMSLFRQITLDEPASPRDLRPDLPVPAAEAILRALAKAPEQRFPSAGTFAQALERGIQNKPPTPTPHSLLARFIPPSEQITLPDATPAGWMADRPRKRPKQRALIVAASVIAALLLVIAGVLFTHQVQPASMARVAIGLTQTVTATQGMATTGAAQGTTQPAGAPPPQNKATQVAIATQVASGTQIPMATAVPGATQNPTATSVPGATPTPVPTATKIPAPTATPLPGMLAIIGNQNPTLPVSTFNNTTYCGHLFSNDGSFTLADITLTNTGQSTLTWTSSSALDNGNTGYVTYSPISGTIPPGGHQDITYTDGYLLGNEIMFVTFTGPANLITEGIYCGG